MPTTFAQYLMNLDDALQSQNGPVLAYLLRPTSPHGKELLKDQRNPSVSMMDLATLYGLNKISALHSHTSKATLRLLGMRLLSAMYWSFSM